MVRHIRFLTVVAVAHLLCVSSIGQLEPGLLRRASTGDATAMHLIGRAAAADGDPVEAYAWFSLASVHGVETSERSALFNGLNPAQLTKATQRIEEIKSTLLRGLPEPSPKAAAPVVDAKRPAIEKPTAPLAVAPAKSEPVSDGQTDSQKAQIAKMEADLAAARTEARAAKEAAGETTSRLEAALARSTQERDALSAELATLRQDKLRAEESLAQMRAKPALAGEVEAQQTRIAKLEAELAASFSEVRAARQETGEATTRLEAALTKATQERDALSGEVAALKKDKLRVEESLAQIRAKPALEGQVETQKAQIAKLEADLAAARTETRTAKAQSGEATTQLEAALAKANQERDALSGENTALRQDRLRAEEARDQIRVELSAARLKLETDLAAARTEARTAKDQAGEATIRLEAALAKATQERDALSGENTALRQDKLRAEESLAQMRAKPALDGQVETQKARIAKLEADLASARTDASTAKAQSGEATTRLEAALARATQERDALSGENTALRQDKLRVEESLAQMRAKPALGEQVETQKTQIAKLEADLAAARTETRTAKAQSGEATTQLEAALAKATQERDAHSGEIAALRQDRLRAEEARDQMRADHAAARSKLEADLAAARSEARATRAQIAQLEADLAAARSETRTGKVQFGESAAQADVTSLREALRESEMKVDMTVRAFSDIEQENKRLQARMREADAKIATADLAARNDSSEFERLRAELARAEQAHTAALASREAAIRDLSAAQIRNDNLVRELSRARPGMLLVPDSTPRAAPSLLPEPATVDIPAPAAGEARVHTVAAGENLSIISNHYYNTPNRWREIFDANRDVMKTENQLVPGMKLRIP